MSAVWTPNDYSNIITIGAAAIGSVLLIVFKSRCKNIKLCCGVVECMRDPKEDEASDEEQPAPPAPPAPPEQP